MKSRKPADILILIILSVAIVLVFIQAYSFPESGETELLIRVDQDSWRYSLENDRIIHIPGPLGETEVHIESGHVHVEDSPCNSKICIAAGEISRSGQWIVCLPNRVFISIEGRIEIEDGGVDDVSF